MWQPRLHNPGCLQLRLHAGSMRKAECCVDSSTAEADLCTGTLVSQTVVGPCQSGHLQAEVPKCSPRGCAAAAALSLAAFPSAAFAAARSRLLLASRSCGQARFAVTRRPLKVAGGVVAPQGTASTKAVQARVMHRLRKLIHKHHSGAHARWHMLCRGFHNMQMLIQEATKLL